MTTIVTRTGKGAPLTWLEADANFTNLNNDKLETSAIGITVQAYSTNLDEFATVNPTVAGLALLDDVDAAAQRTTLGLGTAAVQDTTAFATAAQGTKADSALQSTAIGVSVQAYDAATAKTNITQSFTAPQRGTILTDNDLSFDLSAKNNFTCTPTAGGTLTFTNLAAGQSGSILLVNGANYAIAKAAMIKTDSNFLATISATGTYRLSYYCDGTNVYVTTSGALS